MNMSAKMPRKSEAFCIKRTREGPVLTGNLTALTNMYANVCSVNFHVLFSHVLFLESRGIKRAKLKGTNGAKFAVFFSQIFTDFRFSWELQHFGSADFRRKPQGTRPESCP